MKLVDLFSVLSAIFGLVAAGLWFFASQVEQKYRSEDHPPDGHVDDITTDDDIMLVATARLQSKWNARAALAAGLAGLCQAVTLLAQHLWSL